MLKRKRKQEVFVRDRLKRFWRGNLFSWHYGMVWDYEMSWMARLTFWLYMHSLLFRRFVWSLKVERPVVVDKHLAFLGEVPCDEMFSYLECLSDEQMQQVYEIFKLHASGVLSATRLVEIIGNYPLTHTR